MATTVLKDKTAKPLDLYQQDEESDQEMEAQADNPNYDFDIQDFDDDHAEGEEEDALDDETKARIEQELLFLAQGVGSIKNINNFDVYVKHPQCEYSLKDIHRKLKCESEKYPIVKLTLGQWEFVQKDLIPLLIYHKQDKKLSFLTCMLLVQLTGIPVNGENGLTDEAFEKSWLNPKSEHRHNMLEILRSYKQAFLQPQVISVLMEHLADCL